MTRPELTIADAVEYDAWQDAAACRDRDDVDFFPTPDDEAGTARAKAVCAGCPVADECLTFALETNQSEGIWGGMTASERQPIRRRWLRELKRAS